MHWRVLLTILRLLDRTQQDAMWEYRPTNLWTVCGYVPPPVLVASVVPAFVVEGPEDWEEYTDTLVPVGVSHVEPQPFLLRDYRTGRRVEVLANSVRGLQDLALQHFAIRDPLLAWTTPPKSYVSRVNCYNILFSRRDDLCPCR